MPTLNGDAPDHCLRVFDEAIHTNPETHNGARTQSEITLRREHTGVLRQGTIEPGMKIFDAG